LDKKSKFATTSQTMGEEQMDGLQDDLSL